MRNMDSNRFFAAMLCLPPLVALVLWLAIGFPAQEELTVAVYYVQLAMTAVTIVSIPLLLRLVTPGRCGARYPSLCLLRLCLFVALSLANLLLYYVYSPSPTFFYLGVIMWLAMFFAKRQTAK